MLRCQWRELFSRRRFPMAFSGRRDVALAACRMLREISRHHEATGDLPQARREFAQLAQTLPDWALLHTVQGIVEWRAGDVVAAKASLGLAIAVAPGDPTPYRHLAAVLESEGKAELAGAVREQWRRVLDGWGIVGPPDAPGGDPTGPDTADA